MVSQHFGGVRALSAVNLDVQSGQITALIGPNGAGKSTLFKIIAGEIRPDSGSVSFKGENITGWPPDRIARAGVGRTYQDVCTFAHLSVLENVLVAARDNGYEGLLAACLRRRAFARREGELRERAEGVLEFVDLQAKRGAPAGRLSYGEQKLVALAQLLMADAELLCLDEPAAGVRETMVDALGAMLPRLTAAGKSVLLIEHNLSLVRAVSDRVVVLDAGEIVSEGSCDAVFSDDRVLQAYLGRSVG